MYSTELWFCLASTRAIDKVRCRACKAFWWWWQPVGLAQGNVRGARDADTGVSPVRCAARNSKASGATSTRSSAPPQRSDARNSLPAPANRSPTCMRRGRPSKNITAHGATGISNCCAPVFVRPHLEINQSFNSGTSSTGAEQLRQELRR